MNNSTVFITILLIVIINGVPGHFFAPLGMDLTPAVLIISALLILLRLRAGVYIKSITLFGATVLNDVLIKLYSGGNHDPAGLAWMFLFTLVGLVMAYPILVIAIVRDKQAKWQDKLYAAAAFPIAVSVYLYLFYELGLGRSY